MLISSLQNPKVKYLIKIQTKSAFRRDEGVAMVEGLRESLIALSAGLLPQSVFLCPGMHPFDENLGELLKALESHQQFELSQHVFERLAYRDGSDGIICLFKAPRNELADFIPPPKSLILILESVEKPGNLGAVLRTADAAAVDAVIVCDPSTDLYNPNVIRSSLGCVFTTPVFSAGNTETFQWLKQHSIRIFASLLSEKSSPYHLSDFRNSSALLMGTEATGLSDFWIRSADEHIIIPMLGKIDSLNVSNATAILTFEALRQRDFRHHSL